MKKKVSDISDPNENPSAGSAPAPRRRYRPWLIALLVALALIAAAYGAGSLQGTFALRNAEAGWQKERDQMSAAIETDKKEMARLKAQQALWQLDSGVSEILAHLADKNYGLARDTARTMSAAFSKALADMDDAMKIRLQPLGTLLDDTSRAADSLSGDARLKALQAQALIQEALAGGDAAPRPANAPSSPPDTPTPRN